MEQKVLLDALNAGFPVSLIHPVAVTPVPLPPGSKVATTVMAAVVIGASASATSTAFAMPNGGGSLAITVRATYNGAATKGILVHVRTSYDNVHFDTVDWDGWTPGFTVGATIQETKDYDVSPIYAEVIIENTDPAQSVTAVSVIASIG